VSRAVRALLSVTVLVVGTRTTTVAQQIALSLRLTTYTAAPS
jgi:hypothetical protein